MEKEYYIEDIIKMWREGWRGKIKVVGSIFIFRVEDGGIIDNNCYLKITNIALEHRFTIVPEPVEFKEAFKAYMDGEIVISSLGKRYKDYPSEGGSILVATHEEIDGLWTIEE